MPVLLCLTLTPVADPSRATIDPELAIAAVARTHHVLELGVLGHLYRIAHFLREALSSLDAVNADALLLPDWLTLVITIKDKVVSQPPVMAS
jgi:hypothetical protein